MTISPSDDYITKKDFKGMDNFLIVNYINSLSRFNTDFLAQDVKSIQDKDLKKYGLYGLAIKSVNTNDFSAIENLVANSNDSLKNEVADICKDIITYSKDLLDGTKLNNLKSLQELANNKVSFREKHTGTKILQSLKKERQGKNL